MGRTVATRQHVAEIQARQVSKPLRMLVAADPRSDLQAAHAEGVHIRDELDKEHEFINVNLKASEIPVDFIKSKVRDFDVIHYAGHADYDSENPGESGWLLADGKLTANEIKSMTGKKPMPALVFANACQSGQTDEWQITADYEKDIFGLANSFLVSGVQHYVGTFWDILDDPGHDFALAFYKETIAGASVGEAVRRARLHLVDKYGEETIVWASYMVYGDPTFSYLADVAEGEDTEEVAAAASQAAGHPVTAPGQPAVFRGAESTTIVRPSGMSKTTLGVIGAVFLAVLILGIVMLRGGGNLELHISAGQKALDAGDFQTAIAEFNAAADGEQKDVALAKLALAYNGMGLDLSNSGDMQKAMEAYQEAAKADPKNAQAAINLGQRLLAMGKTAQAKKQFEAALDINPKNTVASTLMAQAAVTMARAQDAQKQAEVNRLVTELADRWKSGKIPASRSAADEWTSRPVTVTFLDFESKGKMTMEGEMDFLKIALAQALRKTGRMEVVEREKIDRIMAELNLASSELANEDTRLRLGRLFGARLIATGSFIRYGDETQVLLRMIETETTLAPVAVSEVFKGKKSAGELAKAVADTLVDGVKSEYPIRGTINLVNGSQVKLNIGTKVGVVEGMKMEVLDKDQLKVGLIEITGAGPDVSKAKVVEGKMSKGAMVREVSG
jgi:CHAT domain-containing protein